MHRPSLVLAALALSLQAPALRAADPGLVKAGEEQEIRMTRERFNRAIENGDVGAMEGLFAPDYHLVTGRSDQFDGAEKHLDMWRQVFRTDPDFNCQREPVEVVVNDDWGLAQETGNWVCNQTVEDTPSRYSGVYAAKWQRTIGDEWVLQAEVFTTLNCDGPEAACRRPDPIAPPSAYWGSPRRETTHSG